MGFLDSLSGAPSADPSGSSTPPRNPDLAALHAQARSSKRKRNRIQDELDAEREQAEVAKLFEAENWEEIASLYFNARFAMTGWNGFLLTDNQKAVLGSTMASTMKLLLRIDPAYIAVIVFSVNMSAFIAQREIQWAQMQKDTHSEDGNG